MAMPKVMSLFQEKRFEDIFPEITILGEPTNLFVECVSYEVQIPVRSALSRPLDIFEEAILRMVRLKGPSANDLADVLCLGKDLVCFILRRLEEKGLLDNKLHLTKEGASCLEPQKKQEAEVQSIQGRVFVLEKSGQILPFIHIGEFHSEKVDEVDRERIVLGYGSAGDPRTVKGLRLWSRNHEPNRDSRLPAQRLREAVLRFNRLKARRGQAQIDLCPGYMIDSSRSDPVYFHLQAVIQEGNSDEILISDGFVPNIDGMAEYMKDYSGVITKVQNRAVRMAVKADGEGPHSAPIRTKYWEIVQSYKRVRENLPQKPYEDATPDERREMDKNSRQIAIDCYHILETVLFYYLKEHPISETRMGALRRQTADQNRQTIRMMAKSLGMRHIAEADKLFSYLEGSRISSVFETGTAHMQICLPLAIAEAKESPDSRVRVLIGQNSNFLRFFQRLGDAAAVFRHDANVSQNTLDMSAKYIAQETANIAHILLPNLQLGDDGVQTAKIENVSQERLLAQASLAKVFGPVRFQLMPDYLRDEWMRISPNKRGRNLPTMSEYVQILYRVFQTTLAAANREFLHKSGILRDDAIQRLTEMYGKPLPRAIVSVREEFYTLAARGSGSSLGAEALVYAANRDGMDALVKAGFVETVDRILSLRGHGSQRADLTEDEHTMGALRDNVIELTKMIGG